MPRATKRKHAQQQRMLLALEKKKRKSTEPEEALLGEGSNGEESAFEDLSGKSFFLSF